MREEEEEKEEEEEEVEKNRKNNNAKHKMSRNKRIENRSIKKWRGIIVIIRLNAIQNQITKTSIYRKTDMTR